MPVAMTALGIGSILLMIAGFNVHSNATIPFQQMYGGMLFGFGFLSMATLVACSAICSAIQNKKV